MNRKVLFAGVLVVAPLVFFLARAFDFDPHIVKSPLVGQSAPNFRLVDLSGAPTELSALRGKPVVINFWATYCPPCLDEHPLLLAASKHYRDRVHFLGIIYQDDTGKIEQFVDQLGAWGPSLVDDGGQVAIAYGVYGPPETFFIDQQGKVVDKVIGAVPAQHLRVTLEGLLTLEGAS